MKEKTDRKTGPQNHFSSRKTSDDYSPLNSQILQDTGDSVYAAYQGNGASGNIFLVNI